MRYFAHLDPDGLVVNTSTALDSVSEVELGALYKEYWPNGGSRKNPASIGYTYDAVRDAFIPPKNHESWVLNEATCMWEPPIAYPSDGLDYLWDETLTSWVPLP